MMFLLLVTSLSVSLLSLALIVRYLYFQENRPRETSSNRAVIITGCDSGIGLELAKYFYRRTNFTIICGFLKPNESDGFKQLNALGASDKNNGSQRLISAKLDITTAQDVEELIDRISRLREENKIEFLDSLINNAGVLTYGEFDWLTWDQIQSQIDVNLLGTMRLTRAVLPMIIESKGRIINVSSVNDLTVFPGLSVYSASKSALSSFSRGLGYELRKFGAHVVTIRLGDFARLTSIMTNHRSQQDKMWQNMKQSKRDLYGNFFQKFNEHILKNYGMTSPESFEDSRLFKDFEQVLLSRNPPSSITCAPLGFKVFYCIMELIPVYLQYYLLDLMLRIGFQWEPPKLKIN